MEILGKFDNYVYVTLITLLVPMIQKFIMKWLDLFSNNIDNYLNQLIKYVWKESKYCMSINYYIYFAKNGNLIETGNLQYYNSIERRLVYYMNDYKENVIDNNKFSIIKTNDFFSISSINSINSINSIGIGDGTNITIGNIKILVKYEKSYYQEGERKQENRKILLYSDISISKIEEFLVEIDNHYKTYNKKYFRILPCKPEDIKSYELNYKNVVGLDSMFFPVKKNIVSLVDKFETNKIDKLALLLYGLPGTSKTTLIRAIGKKLDRDIISIKISKIKNYTEFIKLLYDNKSGVIVFEDVDADTDIVFRRTVGNESEKSIDFLINKYNKCDCGKDSEPEEKLSLSDLLNVFDGILQLTNSVIIMTTNHFEKIDPALIRPGRFKCIELKKLNIINIIDIINFHYKIDKEVIKNKFEGIIKDNNFTSAQMYEYIIESDTVDDLYNLIKNI